MNSIKYFYDDLAVVTADEWYPNDLLKPTIQDFISFLPSKPRVLDLGCGPGHESKRLAAAGAIVTGIDFSDKCINIAKERSPECAFYTGDIRELDSSKGIFDGVFACASLIHISHDEFSHVLQSVRAVLENNGYMDIILLDGTGISEKFSNLEVNGVKYKRTVYLYSKKTVKNEAGKNGFEFVREGFLGDELKETGWRNYIIKKRSVQER